MFHSISKQNSKTRYVIFNIQFLGLNPECHLIPDFSMYLGNDVIDAGLPVVGIFIGSLISVALIGFCSRSKLIALFLILASCICIGLTIWTYDPIWALVGHTIINVLVAGMWSMLVTVFDKYPFWTRYSNKNINQAFTPPCHLSYKKLYSISGAELWGYLWQQEGLGLSLESHCLVPL